MRRRRTRTPANPPCPCCGHTRWYVTYLGPGTVVAGQGGCDTEARRLERRWGPVTLAAPCIGT